MERALHEPEIYDFRQHDRVWQRVRPGLEPYQTAGAASSTLPEGRPAARATASGGELTAVEESRLPGAEVDPCCMGTEAAELLEVLEGYITEELEARQWYLSLACQAPGWARQTLRELAEEEGGHARRLLTVRYLITGRSDWPQLGFARTCGTDWKTALRQSYHEEACTAMNYARSADSTPDVCLSQLLMELSGDEYRHAARLMTMLERSLGRRSGC